MQPAVITVIGRDMREIYNKIRRPDFYGDLVKPKSEEGTT